MSLDSRYLTVEQTAALFQVTPQSVYKWISPRGHPKAGRLVSVKVGDSRRIPEGALEEFIARCEGCSIADSVIPIRRAG